MKWLQFPFIFVYLLVVGAFVLPFSLGGWSRTRWYVFPFVMVMWIVTWALAFPSFVIGLVFGSRAIQQYAFGLDQACNALLGYSRDITLSSTLGDKIVAGKAKWFEVHFCNALSYYDPDYDRHCVEARGN